MTTKTKCRHCGRDIPIGYESCLACDEKHKEKIAIQGNSLQHLLKNSGRDTNPQPEGRKDDSGKLRFDLVPPEAIRAWVSVLTHGADKYMDRNWEKGMAWGRPYAALCRHSLAWWSGEDIDPESGISHLAHAMCNLSFLITYQERNIGKDDRPNTGRP